MPARLFILDGPGYLFRAYHALPYLSNSRGMPVNTVLGMSTMLWKLLREERPDYFAVAWDPPGPTFRDEKFAAYKETRAATPDDLKRQIPFVMQVLSALRVPVLEMAGFEADDVLATVVDRARAHDLDVVLVTQDKDMLQLVGPRVTVLAPGARAGEQVLYDADKVREKWGVGPEQIPDLLALMGDTIDNIPGVPGVGQKTAVKLIGQFGSVDGIYQHLSLVPGKLRETLAANRKQALLSRELATASTRVPLADDLEALRRAEPDWERLRAVWTELELRTLLRQLPDSMPAAPEAEADAPPASPQALAAFLAALPAGAPVAVDWAGEGGPPDPAVTRVGLHHPTAGDIQVTAEDFAAALPGLGRRLIGHDVKHLVEWALARGLAGPEVDDTGVAAYLLNPARSNYRLEEVATEHLGEGVGPARPGGRARLVWTLWEQTARELVEAKLRPLYDEIERPLIPVLAVMERHGIRADSDRLAEFSKELDKSLEALTREIYALAGEEFNLGSPKQLATILFEKLGLPPLKKTKTGYSTDADVLEQLAINHALPAKLIEQRTLSKLKSTYADALPGMINPATGRIHTSLNQLVAATGRLSCLPAGTLVNTRRGLVGIETVRAGESIHTCRGPHSVLAMECTGLKPVLALHLSNGTVFRCSPDHKLRSKGQWKTAAEIQVGDPLYMTFREGMFGDRLKLDVAPTAAYETRKSPRMPTEWSVELAELIGYVMADGHIAHSDYNGKPAKVVLAFGWDEDALERRMANHIVKLFGKEPTFRTTRTCPVLEVSGVNMSGFIEQIGAGGLSRALRVPPSLFQAPRGIAAAFLRGYFEGDGTAEPLAVRSVSRELLEDVHYLLTLFGIPSTIQDGCIDPRGYAPRHTLCLLGDRSKKRFLDRIGFLTARKIERLEKSVRRSKQRSSSELLTLRDPSDILDLKPVMYEAARESRGRVPQRLYVFAHKFEAGSTTITLRRAEQIRQAIRLKVTKPPAYLAEIVGGQYLEVHIERIEHEAPVPMYDIAVSGEQYMAQGIVVHNSAQPNLQNIPVRTELGRRIRAAFMPAKGWRLVAADYSQVELRILAHVCGEESLVEAFRRGEDIHRRTAAEVFGVTLEQVTDAQRDIAKTTNFSVIYGVTAFGLARGLRISSKEAQQYLDQFFARHPKVRAWLDRTVKEGRERGYVETLRGRRRYLPELRSGNPNLRSFAERMATNAPIQGTAADMIKIAMIRMAAALAEARLASRMLLQVHDELLFEAPPDEEARLKALAAEVMEGAMTLNVPLKVDVKGGADWAQV
jgi:DNA polymerase-1